MIDADAQRDPTPAVLDWIDRLADAADADHHSAGSSTTRLRDVEYTFVSDRAGSTFECRVDEDAWRPCTSPLRLTGLAEGPHRLQVRATTSGRTGPLVRARGVLTSPPPEARFTSDDVLPGELHRPRRRGVPAGGPRRRAPDRPCLDLESTARTCTQAAAWTASGSPSDCADEAGFEITGLAPGRHVLEALVYDVAGNT